MMQKQVCLAAACALAACASDPNLRPARTTQSVTRDTAEATADGVQVVAVADAWSGIPDNLAQHVTPIRVRIRNGAEVPIAVRYDHLKLETSQSNHSHPVPPQDVEGGAKVRNPVDPMYRSKAYGVAPYYGMTYRGISPSRHRVPYDFRGYYRGYRNYWTADLPTRDMIARALPEGVVEPGGFVEGFLYFEHFEADDVNGQVTLEFEATNALTGEAAAAISIPFDVSPPVGA